MPQQTQQAIAEKSAKIRKRMAAKADSLKPEAMRELRKRVKRADRRLRRMKSTAERAAKKATKKEAPAAS